MTEKLLYDVVQLFEWPIEETKVDEDVQHRNSLRASYEFLLSNFRKTLHLLRLAGLPYRHANSHAIVNALYQVKFHGKWIFSISTNTRYIVILQAHQLEIRLLDEELTLIGNYNFSTTHLQGKQAIAWNEESTLFSVSFVNGRVLVFDTSCTMLCLIELQAGYVAADLYNVCSMMMTSARTQKDFWNLELFVLLSNGILLNYFLSLTGEYQLYHTFKFGSNYSQGLTCAFLDPSSRLLVIGGNVHSGCIDDGEVNADNFGITKWRILSDYPYYKKDLGESTSSKSQSGMLQRAYGYTSNLVQRLYSTRMDGIFTMSLSPDRSKLMAAHFNGSLSLWDFPSLRMKNMWMLEDQPCHDDVNPSLSSRFGRKRRHNDLSPISSFPFDLSWWNNDAITVSRCSGCLTILSISGSELINLFGNQCEWVTPCCQVTSAHEERLYMLECESIQPKSSKRMKVRDDDDDDDEDDDESTSILRKGMQFAKYLTGKEAKSKDKNFASSYCLVALNKTTPQELYERRLDDREFGEALSIAQAYDLDCDKVFQRQWRNAAITKASIQDYLSKVKNRLWVFRECMDRVPERLDDMKELFEFALRFTDIDKLARISNNDLDDDYHVEELEDYEGFDYEQQQKREIEKRLHFEIEWSSHIDFHQLTLEQNEMIKCRQKILKYKDRLSTYILLQGGYDAANERFTSDDFASFRKRDLFELALEHSRASKWEVLDTLLQYHSGQLKSHWLPLISNFPETMPPRTYICLLPEIVDDDVIGLLTSRHRQAPDWCEKMNAPTQQALNVDEFYEANEDLEKFRTDKLTPELANSWYSYRAREMEKRAHLTEEALNLLEIAVEKGASGLAQLQFDLTTLDNLLFECGCDLSMNLDELLEKTPLERIRLMMAQSIPTSYVQDIQRFVIPFVKKCTVENLFQAYLLETAAADLVLPFVVFKHMISNVSSDFQFKNPGHVIETALDCIYAKEEANQLDIAYRLLNSLPKLDGVDKKQREKVLVTENTLDCCGLLAKYQQRLTPSELRSLAEDRKQVVLLYKRLTRIFTRERVVGLVECENLLDDINTVASKMFQSHVTKVDCIRIFIESLLASGLEENIRLAGDMMVRSEKESRSSRVANRLPYQESVTLVLAASREYFDAASLPLNDNRLIQTSRLCLLLITDHPPVIQEQMNLIEAVILLSAFHLEMLPLEVRLCKDRLEIVEKVLDLLPGNYLKIESILRLASLLGTSDSCQETQKGRALCLIATKAFESNDFKTAISVTKDLIDMNYSQCWKICTRLAMSKEVADIKFKHSCISFACCYCADEDLMVMSNSLRSITASFLEHCLEEEMMRMEEEDEEKLEGPHLVPSLIPGSHTLNTSAQLLAGTVHATTGALRSGWSMLKKKEHVHSKDLFVSPSDDAVEQKNEFEMQTCPSFYGSILPSADNDLYDLLSGRKVIGESALFAFQQQTMLRITALASMRDRMTENLVCLAKQVLSIDLPLGLAYLLSLPEANMVSECFHSLPFTSLSQQLQVFQHSIQILSEFFPSTDACLPIYRVPPSSVIESAIQHCYNGDSSLELHQAVNSLVTYIQAERLSFLKQEVDMPRFATDLTYAQDTVQGLAMTTNEEQLLVAILLADQKSCDIWQVVVTYVEYLFTDTEKPVNHEALEEDLKRLKILPLLVSRGRDLYERFDSRVLPLIDGRDHGKLISYFRLLKKCQWKGAEDFKSSNDICHLPPDLHITYLQKITNKAPTLDYKLLISKTSSERVMVLLEAELNENTVSMFSKLIPNIPYENERISYSSVVLCWLRKQFWSDEESIESEATWLKRLESCSNWFEQLDVANMKLFFEGVLFTERSLATFSYKLRSQILKFALKMVKKLNGNQKSSPDFVSYRNELEKLKAHFTVFTNPFMRDVIESAEHDREKRDFLWKFDQSHSEPEQVRKLAVELAYDSIQFVKKFLSAASHTRVTFNQVMKQCTADVVNKLSDARDDASKSEALALLDRLLTSIERYEDNDKQRIFDRFVSVIQELCDSNSVEISLKIDLLQLLRKSAALKRNQVEFLLYHRTLELIREGWSGDVADQLLQDEKSISDEEFERHLVTSLLDLGQSFDQLKHLSSIVDILTQDSSSTATDDQMWCDVLTAFADHSYAGGAEIVEEAKRRQLSTPVSIAVFKSLTSKSLVLAACKFALITKVPNHEVQMRELLKSVKELAPSNCDDELLRLLIDNDVVICTLSTLYYHRAVEFLFDGNYENNEKKVDSLVRQLQDSNHISEASTLLLRYRGSHTVFATFGSSIDLLSNWLKNF